MKTTSLMISAALCALLATTVTPVQAGKACQVKGVQFTGQGVYIVGKRHVAGSIFANCNNGVATCFLDDGTTSNYKQLSCARI